MCVNTILRIEEIEGKRARMDDGRMIRLGSLQSVQVGDYLEVFADIAFAKVDLTEATSIARARNKGGS